MDIDLDLLEFLLDKGAYHIENSVQGAQHLPSTVMGVATFLLDNEGNIDLLTAKQRVTFDKFIAPLLFNVRCRGVSGPGSCKGSGQVEAERLLSCYQSDKFRCQACRDSKSGK